MVSVSYLISIVYKNKNNNKNTRYIHTYCETRNGLNGVPYEISFTLYGQMSRIYTI